MSEEKKTHKRKLLIRYLILAACILVVAAITVTVVFAANDWFRTDISLEDNDGNHTDDKPNTPDDGNDGNTGNKPSNPDDGKGEDKPTANVNEFVYPVATMNVTTAYDFGKDATLGHWRFHSGLDISADAGSDVVACLDGTVESIVREDQLDGNKIVISHANGLKTVYTFVNIKEGLKAGDTVKRGDVIASVSEPVGSEYALGSHLHFEVLENGENCNPEKYLDVSEK